jgi:hypothetical protein
MSKCIFKGCKVVPMYGEPNGIARHCYKHKGNDVNLSTKKCKIPECNARARYRIVGGKYEYCSKHAPLGYKNAADKICIEPDCTLRAKYKINGIAKYCNRHVYNKCEYKNCINIITNWHCSYSYKKYCDHHNSRLNRCIVCNVDIINNIQYCDICNILNPNKTVIPVIPVIPIIKKEQLVDHSNVIPIVISKGIQYHDINQNESQKEFDINAFFA